ncbi:MAG: radical SAM protein [Thermotogae bacterium]|nr:radical SAM protein [Thermotogota bacterium]
MIFPFYLENFEKIDRVGKIFKEHLTGCGLCPRRCGVDRTKESGFCLQRDVPRISNVVLHYGEEPPLVEKNGAGAVFFCGCNMRCVYCQNFAFSQKNIGKNISVEELADYFLKLQELDATCLDLVTPTPHLPFIVEALGIAITKGFKLPIVYNTSSYESVEVLNLLDGIVDVYLADLKYSDDEVALRLSGVKDYWEVATAALREMYRQVGAFKRYASGVFRGLIVRHLVLPGDLSGSEKVARFIAEELSTSVPVAVMGQYNPVNRAREYPEIARRLSKQEYERVLDVFQSYDLVEGWYQLEDGEPVRAVGVKLAD